MKRKIFILSLIVGVLIASTFTVAAADTVSGNDVEENAVTAEVEKNILPTSDVGGVKSAVGGSYWLNNVTGAAVTTDSSSIAIGYGLGAGETAYVKMSDLDPKKSTAAKSCIDAVAQACGATVGPCVNFEVGKMSSGVYSVLPAGGDNIRVSLGVPGNFADAGKNYAVIRVQPGGAIALLADVDPNPNVVTFNTTAGAGAYAIVKF
ncbi:MAG: hypothetical protein KBT19_00300 [Lachnospiraceae bacterium]|nr:hypothetical protein [Candidatus Colinaster equi]